MGMVLVFQLWKNVKFLVVFNQYCVQKKGILCGDGAKTFIRCILGPGSSQAVVGSECLI